MKKARIGIFDDDLETVKMFGAMMKAGGHSVEFEATSKEEAKRFIEDPTKKIDVALVDAILDKKTIKEQLENGEFDGEWVINILKNTLHPGEYVATIGISSHYPVENADVPRVEEPIDVLKIIDNIEFPLAS